MRVSLHIERLVLEGTVATRADGERLREALSKALAAAVERGLVGSQCPGRAERVPVVASSTDATVFAARIAGRVVERVARSTGVVFDRSMPPQALRRSANGRSPA